MSKTTRIKAELSRDPDRTWVAIAEICDCTPGLVCQIAKKQGVSKFKRDDQRSAIVGAKVRPDVRRKLEAAAQALDVSLSEIASSILENALLEAAAASEVK